LIEGIYTRKIYFFKGKVYQTLTTLSMRHVDGTKRLQCCLYSSKLGPFVMQSFTIWKPFTLH